MVYITINCTGLTICTFINIAIDDKYATFVKTTPRFDMVLNTKKNAFIIAFIINLIINKNKKTFCNNTFKNKAQEQIKTDLGCDQFLGCVETS